MAAAQISKFLRRVISAAVMAPAAFLLILYGGPLFILFVAVCAAVSLYEWIQLSLRTRYKLLFLLGGLIYVPVSYFCCYWIRAAYGAPVALLFIVMVWASDIGAYFTGRKIGGPKMASEISPKKTWAGFAGAMVWPALVALLFFAWRTGFALPDEPHVMMAFALGTAVGAVGQSGDLLASLLKRRAGVKDSGALIPGHGGLLDRVDAMMLSAPVFMFLVAEYAHVFG